MPGEEIAIIEDLIVTVRGQRAILAADLARINGVQTRVLNQAVKRNSEKFPRDFVFQLTLGEAETAQRSRSQIVILKRGSNIKYLPYAFTEHGAIMAANVLNSPRAIQMSVVVVRAFIRMRGMLADTRQLARKLARLERELKARLDVHEGAIVEILQRVMDILDPPELPEPNRRSIGLAPSPVEGFPCRGRAAGLSAAEAPPMNTTIARLSAPIPPPPFIPMSFRPFVTELTSRLFDQLTRLLTAACPELVEGPAALCDLPAAPRVGSLSEIADHGRKRVGVPVGSATPGSSPRDSARGDLVR